ncbi:MAG: sigma-70 family RNA polymerase sigma factor [Balneolaceae bacterium]
MDLSGFITAVRNNDQLEASRICSETTPILKRYLRKKLGADPNDAEDAIQRMFEYIINKIREEEFENPKGILSYMLKTCRHNYIKIVQDREQIDYDYVEERLYSNPVQIWDLVNKENQSILRQCAQQLRKGYREFINYFFSFPNASTRDVAEHFDISVNNAWTRKHRVINKLHDCVKSNT